MYEFYLDSMLLPITPSKVDIKIKGQNKSYTLINESEINILKTPGLTEISFTAALPLLAGGPAYTAQKNTQKPDYYLTKLEQLMVRRTPFYFVIQRNIGSQNYGYQKLNLPNSMLVSLESYTITEDAKDGFEMSVDIKLKQYQTFGTKTVSITTDSSGKQKAEVSTVRDATQAENVVLYVVKNGDTLSSIAKQYLQDSSLWPKIYELNKSRIESAAIMAGKTSSLNGAWLIPGITLIMPT